MPCLCRTVLPTPSEANSYPDSQAGDLVRGRESVSGRGERRSFSAWAVSIVMVSLVPKCPACLGTSLLLATGIGLSMPTIAVLHGVFAVCSFTCLAATSTVLLSRSIR